MAAETTARRLIALEARALLTRLARLSPYALNMPMVPAAAISAGAQSAVEKHMLDARQRLEQRVREFIEWIEGEAAERVAPSEAQKRFTIVRLHFNAVLTQFDIFADVLAQRSEHGAGVWIAGLDAVAADALSILSHHVKVPPVICHLDRGIGAAIRRARTRLPGGDENPVGIIRIPRERMVGSGIASSLIHEAGHQGAALIDLVNSVRPSLIARQRSTDGQSVAWALFDRWISEIAADAWAVGLLGITATQGLLAVVSLPRPFVFRIGDDDPHPFPWFRVKLGCALGSALYPHPQWNLLAGAWEALYPREGLDQRRLSIIEDLENAVDEFVEVLLEHKPEALGGSRFGDLFPVRERGPVQLASHFHRARANPAHLRKLAPALAFAVLGQARAANELSPERESQMLSDLLSHWAVRTSLDSSSQCASTAAVAS